MAADFDILEDVGGKFTGTIVLYDGRAMAVKSCHMSEKIKNGYSLLLQGVNGKVVVVELNDPLLNYKNFNIGYTNHTNYVVWWYRRPLKQYHQGLRKTQMGCKLANPEIMIEENFGFYGPTCKMLEGDYPNIGLTGELLGREQAKAVAFHKDFALSFDRLHKDHILEYRGNKVGVSTNSKFNDFRLLPEFEHLNEALMEALP